MQFKISDELIIATLSGIDASSLVLYGLSVKKGKKIPTAVSTTQTCDNIIIDTAYSKAVFIGIHVEKYGTVKPCYKGACDSEVPRSSCTLFKEDRIP